MAEGLTTQRLLELRKLTRAISDSLRGELLDILGTLAPLLRPKSLLGSYIQGGPKESVRGADRAYKDLQSVYDSVAGSKPFNLPSELRPPLPVDSSTLEITPFEYSHSAKSKRQGRDITVTSPLKWVLGFSGFSLEKLREGLESGDPAEFRAQEFVLNFLIVHVGVSLQKGVSSFLKRSAFPYPFTRRRSSESFRSPSFRRSSRRSARATTPSSRARRSPECPRSRRSSIWRRSFSSRIRFAID